MHQRNHQFCEPVLLPTFHNATPLRRSRDTDRFKVNIISVAAVDQFQDVQDI